MDGEGGKDYGSSHFRPGSDAPKATFVCILPHATEGVRFSQETFSTTANLKNKGGVCENTELSRGFVDTVTSVPSSMNTSKKS